MIVKFNPAYAAKARARSSPKTRPFFRNAEIGVGPPAATWKYAEGH